jgi:hypothetical protein
MGRPKKIKPVVEQEESNVAVEVASLNSNKKVPEVITPINDSLKNLNDIMNNDVVDEIFDAAAKDSNISICKSSVPVTNTVIPKPKPLTELPKDLSIVGGTKATTKGDEDAPAFIVAEERNAINYSVYDDETDRLIQGAFYANRNSGTILAFLKNEQGQVLVSRDEGVEHPVLVLKKRKIYFKKNIAV